MLHQQEKSEYIIINTNYENNLSFNSWPSSFLFLFPSSSLRLFKSSCSTLCDCILFIRLNFTSLHRVSTREMKCSLASNQMQTVAHIDIQSIKISKYTEGRIDHEVVRRDLTVHTLYLYSALCWTLMMFTLSKIFKPKTACLSWLHQGNSPDAMLHHYRLDIFPKFNPSHLVSLESLGSPLEVKMKVCRIEQCLAGRLRVKELIYSYILLYVKMFFVLFFLFKNDKSHQWFRLTNDWHESFVSESLNL